jgi:predicted AAA+ superfamily ATPase
MDSTIRNFLNKPHSGTTYLFLDEIQAVKNWTNVLLSLSNSGIIESSCVVVTGSIAHFLGAETLPGRGTEGNIYYLRTATFRTFVLSLLNYMKIPGNNIFVIGQKTGYTFTRNEVDSMLNTILNSSIDLEEKLDSICKNISVIEEVFLTT